MEKSFRMECRDLKEFNLIKTLPSGYSFRNYNIGDCGIWAKIVTSSGEFESVDKALSRFEIEFSQYEDDFSNRTIFLLENNSKSPIGTATAWYDSKNKNIGRLHWVSIKKDFQGRGLSRPLIYEGVNLLKLKHNSAYLTTQESSWKAIKIYEDCGFVRL